MYWDFSTDNPSASPHPLLVDSFPWFLRPQGPTSCFPAIWTLFPPIRFWASFDPLKTVKTTQHVQWRRVFLNFSTGCIMVNLCITLCHIRIMITPPWKIMLIVTVHRLVVYQNEGRTEFRCQSSHFFFLKRKILFLNHTWHNVLVAGPRISLTSYRFWKLQEVKTVGILRGCKECTVLQPQQY